MYSKEEVVMILRSIKIKNINHMQPCIDKAVGEVIRDNGLGEDGDGCLVDFVKNELEPLVKNCTNTDYLHNSKDYIEYDNVFKLLSTRPWMPLN